MNLEDMKEVDQNFFNAINRVLGEEAEKEKRFLISRIEKCERDVERFKNEIEQKEKELDELENKKQGLVDFKHYKAREILAQIKYVETHLKAIPNLLEVEKALIKELETIWEERFGEELETSESENEE